MDEFLFLFKSAMYIRWSQYTLTYYMDMVLQLAVSAPAWRMGAKLNTPMLEVKHSTLVVIDKQNKQLYQQNRNFPNATKSTLGHLAPRGT